MLNLTEGDQVEIHLLQPYPNIWKAEGATTLNSAKIRDIKRRMLRYLQELGVIEGVQDIGITASLYVDRDKFYAFYEILKTHELKTVIAETQSVLAATKPAPVSASRTAAQPIYEIKFKDGVILLNNLYISKPQYGSINYDFFDYVYKNPNKQHDVKQLIVELGHSGNKKTIYQILDDLGFKGNFKLLFFPKASTRFVEYRNPITAEHLKAADIEHLKVEIGRNK